jgi:hypothetical protein
MKTYTAVVEPTLGFAEVRQPFKSNAHTFVGRTPLAGRFGSG